MAEAGYIEVNGKRHPVAVLELRLTVEDRVTPALMAISKELEDPRTKAAFGAGLTAEELRQHGPGFEVRMPSMDLDEEPRPQRLVEFSDGTTMDPAQLRRRVLALADPPKPEER